MLKGIKLDLKTIAILILGGALILSIIFRRGKDIDYYKNEIDLLHMNNDALSNTNDSLRVINVKLDNEITKIMLIIKDNEIKLIENNKKIKRLIYEKNKITNHVNSLDADGISESLTDYLNKK